METSAPKDMLNCSIEKGNTKWRAFKRSAVVDVAYASKSGL
jgi:hypothetical protein